MASLENPRSDSFRAWVSSAIAVLGALAVPTILEVAGRVEIGDPGQWVVTVYVVAWPLYTAVYVGWGYRVYSRLDHTTLRRVAAAEDREDRRPLSRILALSGTVNTTVSAAVVAVVVTITIAQQPAFRSETVYVILALLTVAASWVLMVFSFAQSYLRLGTGADDDAHFRFSLPGPGQFDDYVTFAVLISTMAATTAADVTSREAWRLVRTNVVIAFVFNSVIIAMMVSFLFGGLVG